MNLSKYWNSEKIELLKSSYPRDSKKTLLSKFPNYTYKSLGNVASVLQIQREFYESRGGDLSILLNNKYKSFYWLGFILADGYISEDGTLKIDLSIKDTLQIQKLAEYLKTKVYFYPVYKNNFTGSTSICRVKIKDFIVGKKIRDYLEITGTKTYTPFGINFIKNKYQAVAFLIGFIDGDGSVAFDNTISINCHRNYEKRFIDIGNMLLKYDIISNYNIIIYKQMVRLSFTRICDTINIKKLGIKLNLPMLERKWDRITKKVKIKNYLLENKSIIKKLRKKNFKLNEICKIINYKSAGNLCTFCKKWKI